MANIFQEQIEAEKPKALAGERIYVYVPRATADTAGIASYDSTYFRLNAGKVYIKLTDPTEIPSLIKIREKTEGLDAYKEGNDYYLRTYLKTINDESLNGDGNIVLPTAAEVTSSINTALANSRFISKGILPYDSSFTYKKDTITYDDTTHSFYMSKVDNNLNNSLSNTTYWKKIEIQGISEAEVNTIVDSAIATHNISNIAHNDIRTLISNIRLLIPTQASAENQLADKNFVNSSIATNTANFVGTVGNVTILNINGGFLRSGSIIYTDSRITAGSVINERTYTEDEVVYRPITILQHSTLNAHSFLTANSVIEEGSVVNHVEYMQAKTLDENISIIEVTNNDYANVINQEIDFSTTTSMNEYDKTLLTNFDYGWVANGAKYDLYRFDIETQTWGLRATAINKGDVALITAYNRYKYNATNQEWLWDYTINTSGFTAAQWAAINSGATAEQISKIGTSALNTTAQNLSDAVNELVANTPVGYIDEDTIDHLINFDTDLETGKLYIIKFRGGYSRGTYTGLYNGSTVTDDVILNANFYQVFKYTNNQLIFENCNLIYNNTYNFWQINSSYYAYARVSFDNNSSSATYGQITNIEPAIMLKGVNGYKTASASDIIYAPTTPGTSGQVLQSNGQNNAPAWVTPTTAHIITNTTVSTWVADSTYTDFGYKAEITVSGITANDLAEVIFGQTEAVGGNYANVVETSSNTITIYSKVNDIITIPTILIIKGGVVQ